MAKKKVSIETLKRKGDYNFEKYAQKMLKELPGQFLLGVSFDPGNGSYHVKCPQYSNLAETAFCVAVVAKAFKKSGMIASEKDFITMVQKYLDDPQFTETK